MVKRKQKPTKEVLLDLGCGIRKEPGHIGLDRLPLKGVDVVIELGRDRWPYEDNSVDGARSVHQFEHLTLPERTHWLNELHRVLKPGARCLFIVPMWSSGRAYGDPTHQWPPVSEFSFFYWDRKWRLENAPHTDKSNWDQGLDCDFEVTWGYGLDPMLESKNEEYKTFAINFYKEAAKDIHAALIKRK